MMSGTMKKSRAATRFVMNDYIECRLNPWSGHKGTGIPDDSDVQRLVIDHRFNCNFVVGNSGGFNIVFAPIFPSCLLANTLGPDTSFSINGVTPTALVGNPAYFYNAGILPEWQGITISSNNAIGKYDGFVPYLYATRARVVVMALNIIFTGSTVANSGYLKVNRDQVSLEDTVTGANATTFELFGSNGSTLTYNAGQVLLSPINMNLNFATLTHDGFQDRLEFGCKAVNRHNSAVYRWVDIVPNVNYLTLTGNTLFSNIVQLGNVALGSTNSQPIYAFWDDEWSATSIQIAGATPGQTFTIECLVCVEYVPSTASAVNQLTAQPPTNPGAVRAAAKAAKDLPVATNDSSVFSSAVNVASGMLKVGSVLHDLSTMTLV
jgi:hypothetical protein